MSVARAVKLIPSQTIFLLCDLQTKFRPVIHEFNHVLMASNKMLKIAKAGFIHFPYSAMVADLNIITEFCELVGVLYRILGFHVDTCVGADTTDLFPFSTELGHTVPELDIEPLGPLLLKTVDKTLFSLVTPEVDGILKSRSVKSAVLMGIESHICILQSALDLVDRGYDVHVLADGVSSCNKEEIPFAFARMRQAGIQVTTSESAAYQLMSDAALPTFRPFSQIIKDESTTTKNVVQTLLGSSTPKSTE